MSLITTTIPNLVNGVSQQPYALRLASQCELLENANCSVVDGLRQRNGTRHSACIISTPLTNAFTHVINRDETERYRVIISGGTIRVFTLDGVEKTVNIVGSAASYLTSSDPKTDLRALTVADHTFILNRSKTVAEDTELLPTRPVEAVVWIRTATASVKYDVKVNSTTATVTAGDASQPQNQQTTYIANDLTTDLTTGLGSGFSVTRQGSLILIKRNDGADFNIECTDSLGDQALILLKGVTQRFSNLPARCFPGVKLLVKGEDGNFNSDYWVEYVSDANNQYGGLWKEGAKPGERYKIDKNTMPHLLVREADGTFTFKAADWTGRATGDLESNPYPSFVGKKINDIFFHKNRFGILADENMVLSQHGEYYNFFRESVIQLLDTDPIDVAAAHTKVSILNHAIPFNESLVLFSDQSQFVLSKTIEVLAPRNAGIDQTTEFECNPHVKPVGVGNSVYFVQNRDRFSAVREFSIDDDTQSKDAQEITGHVPKYIPKNVFKLAASNVDSIMVALSSDEPNAIYVYQYLFVNGEKLQSAWHKWTFPATDTILNADFIESNLHLLVARSNGTFLEVMPVSSAATEGDEAFSVHLDRLIDETQVTGLTYNAGTDTTTFTLPYTPLDGEEYVLVAWDGNATFKLGRKLSFTRSGTNVTVTTKGNLQKFRFGRRFTFRYVMSQLMIKEEAPGGGQISVSDGRIQVRRIAFVHGLSGYFRVTVTPSGRETYTYVFSGRRVGSGRSQLGEVALQEGTFRVPVAARNTNVNIEIISDEYLPLSLLNAEWEAMYISRAKRV
jgi:hypothetical protein